MRITSKGQVTIPHAIRERAGLLPNTEVEFVMKDGAVLLLKAAAAKRATRGAEIVALLRNAQGQNRMTTDEIMALTRGED